MGIDQKTGSRGNSLIKKPFRLNRSEEPCHAPLPLQAEVTLHAWARLGQSQSRAGTPHLGVHGGSRRARRCTSVNGASSSRIRVVRPGVRSGHVVKISESRWARLSSSSIAGTQGPPGGPDAWQRKDRPAGRDADCQQAQAMISLAAARVGPNHKGPNAEVRRPSLSWYKG